MDLEKSGLPPSASPLLMGSGCSLQCLLVVAIKEEREENVTCTPSDPSKDSGTRMNMN